MSTEQIRVVDLIQPKVLHSIQDVQGVVKMNAAQGLAKSSK